MTFERKLITKSFVPDIMAAFIIFGYSLISAQIPSRHFWKTMVILIAIIAVFQFTFAILTDHLAYTSISKRITHFETTETTENERTQLLEAVQHIPFTTAFMTFLYFIAGSILMFCIYYFKFKIRINVCVLLLLEFSFGSFVAAMFGENYSRKICNSYSIKIVKKGINADYAIKKRYFGNSMFAEMIIFIVLPILFTTIISCMVLIVGYIPGLHEQAGLQINRMLWTSILNIVIEVTLILIYYRTMYLKNRQVSFLLQNMIQSNIGNQILLNTDLSNEVSFSHYLINGMILKFRGTLRNISAIANEITESSSRLLKISSETESTSVEQSTGTKEIVTTMEDISRLSGDIEMNAGEVSDMAEKTVNAVMKGSNTLEINLQKMARISEASQKTILGIQNLNEKINNIREITNIINSIADQTKIIAFNAELEATNVRNENRNFKNVSSEIRRLANLTMDSTREIKERIAEIQNSSDELIHCSTNATNLIAKGSMIADELKNKFNSIKTSAETNASAASEIKYLINQQNSAFEQIVSTLQQINGSILNFSESTRTIMDTADVLHQSVNTLEKITNGGIRTDEQA